MAFLPRTISFKNNRVLQQYVLSDVTPTGKILGTGSYGSVLEVTHGRLQCAAKKIHDSLFQDDNEGVDKLVEKYEQECQIMASLRHPNITLFLGICYLPDTQLPLLVMEQLDMSLDDLLEYVPNLPLTLKVSFLEDVCRGLHYLHNRNPPIVHRDLTAKNVLLTSSLSAKITDMGNSRIVSMRPGQYARTLSKLPGTWVYMPPEALSDDHRYGPSLDIFSLGNLALYTLTQVFPENLLQSTYYDPGNPNRPRARTELERRATYVERLETLIAGYNQPVIDLVRQCLDDIPRNRPSSDYLLEQIHTIRNEVERSYGGSSLKQVDVSRVILAKDMKRNQEKSELNLRRQIESKDREIESLQSQLEEKQHREVNLQCQRKELQQEMEETRQQQQIQRLRDKIQHMKIQVDHKEGKIQQLTLALQQLTLELQQKEKDHRADLLHKDDELSSQKNIEDKLKQEIAELKEELKICQEKIQLSKEKVSIKLPLPAKWMCDDMPFGMSDYIQSVVIQETVYVGGGSAGEDSPNNFKIMAYDTNKHTWLQLPPNSAKDFAMVDINNHLVLVGGRDSRLIATNRLSMWEVRSKKWTRPYKNMLTARSYPSAVVHKQWLIVAGGKKGERRLSSLEVLDLNNDQWHSAPPTPTPWSSMKSTILGDMWYLMGACTSENKSVYGVSLTDLISHVMSSTSSSSHHNMWKKISGLKHNCSSPLSVDGALLAVGGMYQKVMVSTIHCYVPDTEEWVEVGSLPSPIRDCACTFKSDQQILIFGGNVCSKSFYTCNLK